jgi:hypothetical protein
MRGEISGEKTGSRKDAKHAKDAKKTDRVDFALLRGLAASRELLWLFHTF